MHNALHNALHNAFTRKGHMFTRQAKKATKAALIGAAIGAYALGVTGVAQAAGEQALAGHWLGQSLAGMGSCGTAVGEFTFVANGTYVYKNTSENCAGFAVGGHYTLQGSTLRMTIEQCSPAMCPNGAAPWSLAFSAVDQNTFVLDGRFMYHRDG